MSPPLIIALLILGFAAGFHLHWAFGGWLGYSVSLPQRPDGTIVRRHREGWWRPAAGAVALVLVLVGLLALAVAGHLTLPLPRNVLRVALIMAGAILILRAIVPTPWTGFFKTIRGTRWARYDTFFYSPLILLLGLSLLAVALDWPQGPGASRYAASRS
jgi:hypothetical protein